MNNFTENEVTLEELQNWTLNNFKNVRFMDENLELDVMDITVILQSVGFKLDKYEQKENQPDDSSIKVDLMCSKSGLSTSLSKHSQTCKRSDDSTISMDTNGSSSQVLVSASSNIAFPQLSATRQKFIRILMNIIMSIIKKDDMKEEFKFFEAEKNAQWLPLPPPPRASSPQPNLTEAVRKVKKETKSILGTVMGQLADLQKVIDSNLSVVNGCTFVENGRRISDIASNSKSLVINLSPPKSEKTGRIIRKLASPKIKTLIGTKKKWDSSAAKVGSFRQISTPSLQKKSDNKSTPQSKPYTISHFQEKTNSDTPVPCINSVKKSGAIPKRTVSSSKLFTRN